NVGRIGRNRLICDGADSRGRIVRARHRRPSPAARFEPMDGRGLVLVARRLAEDRRLDKRDIGGLLELPPRGWVLLARSRRRARDRAPRWTSNAGGPRSRHLGADRGDPARVWVGGGFSDEEKGPRAGAGGGRRARLPAGTGPGAGSLLPVDALGASAAYASPRRATLPQNFHRDRSV